MDSETLRRAALLIACALAILVPIPFGSTHPLAIVLIGIALVIALVALWSARDAICRPPARFGWLVLLTLALPLAHLVPLPAAAVESLSPRLAEEARASLAFPGADAELLATEGALAELAGGETYEPSWRPTTIDPDGTLEAATRLAIALAAFCVGLLAVRDSRERRWLVGAVALSAFIQAVYGLAESLSGHYHILHVPRTHYIPLASGTFICPNHFAALLSLGLFAVLGLVTELWMRGEDRFSDRAAKTGLGATAAAVILVAMIWSSSRAGLGAAAIGVLIFAALAIWKLSSARLRLVGAIIVAALAAALVSGAVFIRPPEPLASDVENMSMDLGSRTAVWRTTAEIIGEFPIVGSGLGTYRYFHPQVRIPEIGTRTVHAHNDYLEWVSDTGFVGAPILAAWIVLLFIGGFLAARRQRGLVLTLAIGSGLAALAVHELVDFSLQLSGVAVPAFLLGGAWLAPLAWGPHPRVSRDPRAWMRVLPAITVLLAALCAVQLWQRRPLPARAESPPAFAADSGKLRSWARGLVDDVVARASSASADMEAAERQLGAALVSLQRAGRRSPMRGDVRLSLWWASQAFVAIDPTRENLPEGLVPLFRSYLERAESLAPYDRRRAHVLIRTWLLAGDPDEARRVAREIIKIDPGEAVEAYETLGGHALSLAELMAATPNEPGGALALARYLATERGDQSGAQIVLERALARASDDWRLRCRLAHKQNSRARFEAALATLSAGNDAAIPAEELASCTLAEANAYGGLGRIEAFEALAPRLAQAGIPANRIALLRGRTLRRAGLEDDAARAYEAALVPARPPLRDAERLHALVALANIERTRANFSEARRLFERARRLDPTHPQVVAFFEQN